MNEQRAGNTDAPLLSQSLKWWWRKGIPFGFSCVTIQNKLKEDKDIIRILFEAVDS